MLDKWRTPEAAEYRKMYATKHWRYLRDQALLRDGYRCQHKGCGVFLRKGRSGDNAAVVHHIKPHKGDPELFFSIDNLQSVCKRHHDSDLQSAEARGYDTEVGPDGWPIDPEHPGVK
jgi:5-methylcytosine-specific restriction endonuclease McrA